jgi:hypothetical protein
MARIVRLTESDLTRLVKRVIQESKKIGSFNDEMGWFDEDDMPVNPDDFGDDYEEEEFDEFEPMYAKHGKDTRWFPDSPEGMSSYGAKYTGKEMFDKYRESMGKPFRIRTRRSMTESDLGRITRRVIMEEESAAYHMFVEKLDDIEEDMKKKNMTDEDLDDIREELENEKSSSKDSNNGLSGIEIKKLNKRINSLITKLKGKYKHERFEPMRVKSRIGMD